MRYPPLTRTLPWAAALGASLFLLHPAHAQNLHECSADEMSVVRNEQPSYWQGSGLHHLVINGVDYAEYGYAIHSTSASAVEYVVALRDARADGKPPYLFLLAQQNNSRSVQGPWIHNYFGAASGRWSCSHSTLRATKGFEFSNFFFLGSVDNDPSVPEVVLAPLGAD